MADIRHLENYDIVISQQKIILDEIWYTTANLKLDDNR